jgi:membrane protein
LALQDKGGLRKVFSASLRIWQAYWRDEVLILSAAVSFYAIFSVIPFLFLLFLLWGYLMGSSDTLYGQLVQYAYALFPEIRPEILDDLKTVVEHRSALGWVGIGFLVWIFDAVFYSIAHAFDRIFGSESRRRYYRIKIFSFALLILVGLVLYASIHVAVLATMIRSSSVRIFGVPVPQYLFGSLAFRAGVFLILVAAFTVLFRIVPRVPVRLPVALAGGVLCAALWSLARVAFHWYVTRVAVFNVIYGALGALVVLVLWIFYCANILLICAECVALWNGNKKGSAQEVLDSGPRR